VFLEGGEGFARGGVSDAGRVVVTAGHDLLPVRAEGDCEHDPVEPPLAGGDLFPLAVS
jgi:hypothetical protein